MQSVPIYRFTNALSGLKTTSDPIGPWMTQSLSEGGTFQGEGQDITNNFLAMRILLHRWNLPLPHQPQAYRKNMKAQENKPWSYSIQPRCNPLFEMLLLIIEVPIFFASQFRVSQRSTMHCNVKKTRRAINEAVELFSVIEFILFTLFLCLQRRKYGV